MGHMKDLLITIYNGGDEAVAAVERMGKDWREQLEQAAAEIERRWIPVGERLPEIDQNVLACHSGEVGISHRYVDGWYWDVDEWHKPFTPSHWMPLPEPPG